MAKPRTFLMLLDNRTERPVPADLALGGPDLPVLLGVDGGGHLVAEAHGMTYALTPCCNASAKGSSAGDEPAIVCRTCYTEVDPYFGGPATVAHAFIALTPAERNAAKQGWRIDATPKMDDLRAALAAVEVAEVPADVTDEAERARLTRNAKVNAWRERTRLQAAIDRRTATYALLRAAKAPRPVAVPNQDVAGPVDALAGVTSDADGGL